MDNANQHGMYHDSGVFGMVRSDCNLPRDGNQFQNVGASPSAACDLPPNNPERSSNEKKKNAGARSKFKAFFDKFAARRHADTKGVVPLNDTGSISGVEPFPDFYSVGRGNPNNACQAASGGENTGMHTPSYNMSDHVFAGHDLCSQRLDICFNIVLC